MKASGAILRRINWPILIEAGLACCIIIGIYFAYQFLFSAGYLPPPFVYDPNDTFMDWYNTSYFAVNGGIYDNWGSIYPPVSFVFLKIFSIHSCYEAYPVSVRDCDWVGRVVLFALFFLNALLIYRHFRMVDAKTAIFRSIALAVGLPMLFTLERGNLILPCFTLFLLGTGRLLRSARLKWVAIGLAINFKPYLLAAVIPQLLRRRWRWFEGCAVASIGVYIVTFAILGVGLPSEIAHNMLSYVAGEGNSLFGSLYYAASFAPLLKYLKYGIPLIRFIGSRPIDIVEVVVPILVGIGQIAVLITFIAAAFEKQLVPAARLGALGMSLALSSAEFGGYAEVFLLFFLFQEQWRGPWRIIALFCAYLLCIPFDYVLVSLAHQIEDSYLTGRTVGNDLSLTFGTLTRPLLIFIIQYALSLATLGDFLQGRFRRPPEMKPLTKAPATA